jgi:uncharacterized phage-associated protein
MPMRSTCGKKLLFYTHGWHLAITGQPAIDQPFEVWQWGPVVPRVYHELKKYGGGAVTGYVKDMFADKPYVVNVDRICRSIHPARKLEFVFRTWPSHFPYCLRTPSKSHGNTWSALAN